MAKKGGKQPGAGRPKGAANKVQVELIEQAKAGGQMPLDYLLEVARDLAQDDSRRMDAAKACLPYLHRKMPEAREVTTKGAVLTADLKEIASWTNEQIRTAKGLAASFTARPE